MKKPLLIFVSGMLLLGIAFTGAWSAEVDFEGLPAGTIVDELSDGLGISGGLPGTVGVHAVNPSFGAGTNAAVIFDSSCPGGICSGEDYDLGTPNENFGGPGRGAGGEVSNEAPLGNVLIVGENLNDGDGDGLVDDPDDENLVGASIEMDFSTIAKNGKGTVTFNGITVMDVERKEVVGGDALQLYGPGGLDARFTIPETGNNGVIVLDGFALEGVSRMVVLLNGSGAIESVVVNEEEPGVCWITTGGFTAAVIDAGNGKMSFGGNVGPPPSGALEVIDHALGLNFHSNDVEIVECLDIGTTGPGQPGGKKGFAIDKATFAGTGRVNGVDGFCFTGYVIDAGEPQGRKDNDSDQIGVEITDCSGGIVYANSGELIGGNVQIHPPVGQP